VRDRMARLDPIEPPPSMWSAVEQRLAEAEIADARRSWVWLRWHAAWAALRPRLLPGAVVVAAAVALVLWLERMDEQRATQATRASIDAARSQRAAARPPGQSGRA